MNASISSARTQMQAVLWMMLTGFLAVSINTAMKWLTPFYSPYQLVFFYNGCALVFAFPWLLARRVQKPSRRALRLFLLRASLEWSSFSLIFYAISRLAFPSVTALQFLSPVFASMLAVVFLKEKSGRAFWFALGLGFFGVLLITRFGLAGFEPAWIIVIMASFGFANCSLLIKLLSRIHGPATIAFYMVSLTAVISLPMAVITWKPVIPSHIPVLACIGLLVWTVQMCVAKAFGKADMTVVLPFVFPNLLWSSLYSFFLFREIVSGWTLAGGFVIVISAVLAFYRTRRQPLTSPVTP